MRFFIQYKSDESPGLVLFEVSNKYCACNTVNKSFSRALASIKLIFIIYYTNVVLHLSLLKPQNAFDYEHVLLL